MTPLYLSAVVMLFLAMAAGAGEQRGQNLIQNGNADSGEVNQAPPSWTPATDDQSDAIFPFHTVTGGRGGGKAIRIDRPVGLASVRILQEISIHLTEPTHYRFSVWLRSDRDIKEGVDQFIKTVVPPAPGSGDLKLGWTRAWAQSVAPDWAQYILDFYPPAAFDDDGKPIMINVQPSIQLRADGPLYIDDAWFGRMSLSEEEKTQIVLLREAMRAGGAVRAPFSVKGGIISRPDGTLLAFPETFTRRVSTDGGRSWGGREKLAIDDAFDFLSGAIQMSNGDIGVWSGSWRKPMYFWRSTDGGQTWSSRISMGPVGAPYHGNCMIELRSPDDRRPGRLVIGIREAKNYHAGIYEPAGAYGTINGKRVKVEGHGHDPELEWAFTYYSDDGGRTWARSEFDVFVWKDDGLGGMWLTDEPNVAELKDGRLVMFIRTTLGRLYQSFSTDRSRRWGIPVPTVLPSSVSPCSLETIPENPYTLKTGRAGDLLCVWNNVSRAEVRKGYRRARLCSAVSKDDGRTWQHVRTLAAIGVDPLDSMAQLDEPAMTRAQKDLGELPMPFGSAAYPDITVHGEEVLVHYYMTFVRPSMSAGGRLFIRPMDWYYGLD